MFSHEGPNRSARHNRALAAYLALNAGFVNSAGFVLVGTFTSHVTGNVARLADHLVRGNGSASMEAAILVIAFGAGAFWASLILEALAPRSVPRAYAVALLNEAALLAGVAGYPNPPRGAAVFPFASGILLSFSMGMQNSLVTTISHARVRTTHLTGVVTDLSIELARWGSWFKGRRSTEKGSKPSATTLVLLLTILVGFLVGAVGGVASAIRWHQTSMVAPAVFLLSAGIYAFSSNRKTLHEPHR